MDHDRHGNNYNSNNFLNGTKKKLGEREQEVVPALGPLTSSFHLGRTLRNRRYCVIPTLELKVRTYRRPTPTNTKVYPQVDQKSEISLLFFQFILGKLADHWMLTGGQDDVQRSFRQDCHGQVSPNNIVF